MLLVAVGAGLALVVIVVAVAALVPRPRGPTRERERERRREPQQAPREELAAAVLMQSGLPDALARLGFVQGRPGHFTRGALEVHGELRHVGSRTYEPKLERVDVRVLLGPLAFAADFVARAERGRDGSVQVEAHVEVREGDETVKRSAPHHDRDRFRSLVTTHLPRLEPLSWTSVEVFHHRHPRVHLSMRPSPPASIAEQLDAALREAELLGAALAAKG